MEFVPGEGRVLGWQRQNRKFHVPSVVATTLAVPQSYPPTDQGQVRGVEVGGVHRAVVVTVHVKTRSLHNLLDVDVIVGGYAELELNLPMLNCSTHALPSAVVRLLLVEIKYS